MRNKITSEKQMYHHQPEATIKSTKKRTKTKRK